MLSPTFCQGINQRDRRSGPTPVCNLLWCHCVLELVCAVRAGSKRAICGNCLSDYVHFHVLRLLVFPEYLGVSQVENKMYTVDFCLLFCCYMCIYFVFKTMWHKWAKCEFEWTPWLTALRRVLLDSHLPLSSLASLHGAVQLPPFTLPHSLGWKNIHDMLWRWTGTCDCGGHTFCYRFILNLSSRYRAFSEFHGEIQENLYSWLLTDWIRMKIK